MKISAEPKDPFYAEALYYAGYASRLTGKNKEALQYYEQALQLNYSDPLLYNDLTQLYEEMGNASSALKTVSTGRQRFPSDTTLQITEINTFLSTHNFIKAEKGIEEYLKLYPKNIDVLLVAGTVYDKVSKGNPQKSNYYFLKRKEVLSKALALDPNNFFANYNMGITLYNRGVDLIKSQPTDLDIVLLFEILEKVSLLFQEARPFVEKANSLAPNNRNAMKALEGIYYNLNEKEKSRQIRSKLNETK